MLDAERGKSQSGQVLQLLADRWQDAADEAKSPTLRDCYRERAARYREMAAQRTCAKAESQPV